MRLKHAIGHLSLLAIGAALIVLLVGTAADSAMAKRTRTATARIGVDQARKISGSNARRCTTRARPRNNRRSGRRPTGTRRCASDATQPGDPAQQPSPTQQPSPAQHQAAPSSIYWGAWLGRQLTGGEAPWDMSAVTKFEQMAGKSLSVLQFGSPFANCYGSCYFYGFPTDSMQRVREHGSIPFLSWSSQRIPTEMPEPDYQLSDVARGDFDSYIRSFAKAAAAWGHPFFLRFDHEMNGDWFPWGAAANGNNAAQFVAAWRHVHDIFTAVGATNATWVWCPNVDPDHDKVSLSSLYPGSQYVDWTCLDGYNWGTNPSSPQGWASFDHLFRSTYDEVTEKIAPGKPMIVAETGSSEYGGSKAAWLDEMLTKIPTEYPSIRGLLYFERYDSGMDWPLETSSSATSAFASGIQNAAYATNTFGHLSAGGPIAPPSG